MIIRLILLFVLSFSAHGAATVTQAGGGSTITTGLPIHKFLTAACDGTGSANANLNFATSTDWCFTATAQYDVVTVLVVIADNANFNQTDYGAITGGVTHGVRFFIHPAGTVTDIPLLSGTIVHNNEDWLMLSANNKLTSFAGLSQTLSIEFDLKNSFGLSLTLSPGDKFIVRLFDDFTGLVSQSFALRGIQH